MELRLLGPLEATDGDEIAIGGPRVRRLLVSLVLAEGSVRSMDALIDVVWPEEEPPAGARRTLMSYVSRLRSGFPDGVIQQLDSGYRLDLTGLEVDANTFEHLVTDGRRALQVGNPTQALASFDEALLLWRGEPFAEFRGEHWIEAERVRLTEIQGSALEGRIEAQLSLGHHAEVLNEIERTAGQHPEREHLQYLHMLTLYRSGRQTEALRKFQLVRERLANMGLEPGQELTELEHRILAHDTALDEPGADPGTSIRGYQLGRRLGEGAFGTIYLATQPSVGREVAVKVIRPELANDVSFVRRFETEAQVVARLEHPHIVPLYDFWREPGGAYLVMRYLRGGTAEERLVTDGPMTLAAVGLIVDEVGGALAAAHARGVIHRDVKPANILFDEDGAAYLADFGIALLDDSEAPLNDFRSAGSPLYVSPEQVRGKDASEQSAVSTLSDVYSFGVVLYELLVGAPPFSAGSVQEVLRQKLRNRLPSVRDARPDVPAAVDLVIARATSNEPLDRFPDMGELILAFRAAVASTPQAATTGGTSFDPNESRPRAAASRTLMSVELDTINPYKGLRAFQEADAQDFFGRNALIDEIVRRAQSERFVAVVGASGSGKSSAVRAGVIPRFTGHDCFVVTIVPGTNPLDELESGLLRIATGDIPGLLEQLQSPDRGLTRAVRRVLPPGDSELVLVIDQFEELFTTADESQRRTLLDGLVDAILDERSRIHVIITIRADFYDRPLHDRDFGQLLQDHTVNVLSMSVEEMRAAITGPAAALGVRFEAGLVDEIVTDVGEHATMLPLLQYALTELYERRQGAEITLAAYREIGGVTGALAGQAEAVHTSLDDADRLAARRLFTRLVTPGEGTEDTRRRASRSELTMVDQTVVDAFGASRLLSFDVDPWTRAPTVEVAHEALIREWPRLRAWLDEDRDGLRTLRHLTATSRAWHDADADPDELYRGARLDAALDWADDHTAELATEESAFLAASLDLRVAEDRRAAERAEQRERQNRRLRRSLVGVGVLAIMALLAGLFAFQQQSRAQDRADDAAAARAAAETRRLVSDAPQLAETNGRVALLLAAEAWRRDPGTASLGALKGALAAHTDVLGFLASDQSFSDITWTATDQIIGVTERGAIVMSPTGDVVQQIDFPGAQLVTARADGAIAAIAGSDSSVRLFDMRSGDQLGEALDHGARVTSIAFSGDGLTMATGDRTGRVRIYDVTGELVRSFEAHPENVEELRTTTQGRPHEPLSFVLGVIDLSLDETGTRVATVGGTFVRLFDTQSGELLFSRDVGRTNKAGEIDLETPAAVEFIQTDGEQLIGAASLSGLRTWSHAGVTQGHWPLEGVISGSIANLSLAVEITDEFAVGVGQDGRVLYAVPPGRRAPPLLDTQLSGSLHVSVNPDGTALAVGGPDGIALVSLIGQGLISRSSHIDDGLTEWYVSIDGTIIAGGAVQGDAVSVRRWGERGFEEVDGALPDANFVFLGLPRNIELVQQPGSVSFQEFNGDSFGAVGPRIATSAAFLVQHSHDGRLIAVARGRPAADATVGIYDASSGEHLIELPEMSGTLVRAIEFSPDDTKLVAASDEGEAVIYHTDTWESTTLSAGGGLVLQARYTPDGKHLVTANSRGEMVVRDVETLQPDGRPLLGNTDATEGWALGPRVTPDGRFIVTTIDNALRLWSFEDRVQVGPPFPSSGGIIGYVPKSGGFGLTWLEGRIVVWDLDVDSWPEIACRAAGRNLTQTEWDQFGPSDEPYQITCPQWPSLAEATSS